MYKDEFTELADQLVNFIKEINQGDFGREVHCARRYQPVDTW